MLTVARQDKLIRVAQEAMREIGVLLLAFTPLDAVAWRDTPDQDSLLLRFLLAGALLLGTATVSAVRRADACD